MKIVQIFCALLHLKGYVLQSVVQASFPVEDRLVTRNGLRVWFGAGRFRFDRKLAFSHVSFGTILLISHLNS